MPKCGKGICLEIGEYCKTNFDCVSEYCNSGKCSEVSSVGVIIGIIAAVVVLAFCVACIVVAVLRRNKITESQ